MCVSVCVWKVCFGWGRAATGAETETFSSHERGRRDTKVSVRKTHSYNTFEEKTCEVTRVFTRVVTVVMD